MPYRKSIASNCVIRRNDNGFGSKNLGIPVYLSNGSGVVESYFEYRLTSAVMFLVSFFTFINKAMT